MPRKRKNVETVVASPQPSGEDGDVVVENDHDHDHDPEDSEPTELNRLISEEEYSNGKAEVVVMNHTPATSSPSSSNSRHNSQSRPVVDANVDEDLDKISSEGNREPNAPPEDEDVVDEATRLTKPEENEEAPVLNQPSGEYKKIMEMLKEAEAEADPEYEEAKRRMEYLVKYNPRHPDSGLGFMDYCCAFFNCFALCIEG